MLVGFCCPFGAASLKELIHHARGPQKSLPSLPYLEIPSKLVQKLCVGSNSGMCSGIFDQPLLTASHFFSGTDSSSKEKWFQGEKNLEQLTVPERNRVHESCVLNVEERLAA